MYKNVLNPTVNRSRWTQLEDEKLVQLVNKHQHQNWQVVAKQLGVRKSLVSQSVTQSVGHPVSQLVTQSVDHPFSRSPFQSVTLSIGHPVSQSITQSVNQLPSRSINYPVGQVPSQSVTQSVSWE